MRKVGSIAPPKSGRVFTIYQEGESFRLYMGWVECTENGLRHHRIKLGQYGTILACIKDIEGRL